MYTCHKQQHALQLQPAAASFIDPPPPTHSKPATRVGPPPPLRHSRRGSKHCYNGFMRP